MMERTTEASPRFKAKLAAVFYLVTILTGVFAAVFGRRIEGLFYAANLIADACYVIATLLLYNIFKPVNRSLSLITALFSLVGCAIGVLSLLRLASSPIHTLVFFGFYCLLIGYLIFRPTFLPRILGAGMVIAGLGWLTFLSPPLGRSLFPYTMVSGIICEGALTLWLLVVGVNEQRWKAQASAAAESQS
ncbi:MAG: DUF4386 domain-containing protein [Acidobacteria bacterium]|nr:DUF4386 domain-containing protein [Acidobacteriota bacterium]MBI3655312.1 DUF4386 domain-containing protein [Acidobacteriota bacterium]